MKRIDAVIRPEKLDAVKERLASIGIQGVTASEVRGFGRQRGHTETYRGTEYSVDFLPKIQLSILTSDELVAKIVDAIIEGARTGKLGDGKISVSPVDDVIRIRNGDRGEASL